MHSQKSSVHTPGSDKFTPKHYNSSDNENTREELIPLTAKSSGTTTLSALNAELAQIALSVQSQSYTGTQSSSGHLPDSSGRDHFPDRWRQESHDAQQQSLLPPAPVDPSASLCPQKQKNPAPCVSPPSYDSVVIASKSRETITPAVIEEEAEVVNQNSNCGHTCLKIFFSFLGHVGCFVGLMLFLNEYFGASRDIRRMTAYAAGLGASYLLVLLESGFSDTRSYTHTKDNLHDLTSYIQNMRRARPKFEWRASGRYYETKTRTVIATLQDGTMGERTETYLGDSHNFNEKREFSFCRWQDISDKRLVLEDEDTIVIFKFDKSFKFANDAIAKRYQDQKEQFQQECLAKDKNMRFVEKFKLEDFKETMIVSKDRKSQPCLMHPFFFWISTFLLLSWCYRLWYRGKVRKYNYTFAKEITECD